MSFSSLCCMTLCVCVLIDITYCSSLICQTDLHPDGAVRGGLTFDTPVVDSQCRVCTCQRDGKLICNTHTCDDRCNSPDERIPVPGITCCKVICSSVRPVNPGPVAVNTVVSSNYATATPSAATTTESRPSQTIPSKEVIPSTHRSICNNPRTARKCSRWSPWSMAFPVGNQEASQQRSRYCKCRRGCQCPFQSHTVLRQERSCSSAVADCWQKCTDSRLKYQVYRLSHPEDHLSQTLRVTQYLVLLNSSCQGEIHQWGARGLQIKPYTCEKFQRRLLRTSNPTYQYLGKTRQGRVKKMKNQQRALPLFCTGNCQYDMDLLVKKLRVENCH